MTNIYDCYTPELRSWLATLPVKKRLKEMEIADQNIKRILIHKGLYSE